MNKHKHHIIPRYRCKELGIDPDFPENIVKVTREDHALIHWGYFCDDLKPLFEYVRPSQEIIDLIPRGDNRDVGGAVLNARGEIDGIDMFGENNPRYKDGRWIAKDQEQYLQNHRNYRKTPHRIAYKRKWDLDNFEKEAERLHRFYLKKKEEKLIERQGEGSLEDFLT